MTASSSVFPWLFAQAWIPASSTPISLAQLLMFRVVPLIVTGVSFGRDGVVQASSRLQPRARRWLMIPDDAAQILRAQSEARRVSPPIVISLFVLRFRACSAGVTQRQLSGE